MPLKLLITGASGFLGWNFCRQYGSTYDIVGTYFQHPPKNIKNITWLSLDLLQEETAEQLLSRVKPDIILHLAAIAKTDFCEKYPVIAHHVNVYAVVELAAAAAKSQIPFIFTSTDLVFNGSSAPYTEDDFCYPLSLYGQQKQMAEETILNDFDNTVVVRLPLLFGATPPHSSNFFVQTISKLQQKEKVFAFEDEIRTALSGTETARWLARLIDQITASKCSERLLHFGANKAISRYDFVLKMAQIYQLDNNLVIPTLQKDLDLIPPRPANVSLQNSLAKQVLNFNPLPLEKQLLTEKKILGF